MSLQTDIHSRDNGSVLLFRRHKRYKPVYFCWSHRRYKERAVWPKVVLGIFLLFSSVATVLAQEAAPDASGDAGANVATAKSAGAATEAKPATAVPDGAGDGNAGAAVTKGAGEASPGAALTKGAGEPEAKQAAAPGESGEGDAKMVSGMSILGNKEAPMSLFIDPWKSSELGAETSLTRTLDERNVPVDREVFLRELAYYEVSAGSKTPASAAVSP